MKTWQEIVTESKLPASLEKFLNKFPDDADGWNKATDEIVDVANFIDELLEIDTLPKGKSKTPSEFNQKHKKRIRDNYPKLSDELKKQLHKHFNWL